MLMQRVLRISATPNGVDHRKAETIARRVAKAAHAKAVIAWDRGQYRDLFRSRQEFLDFAYEYTYRTALRRTLARQKARLAGYKMYPVL
jgi:hypothetical protein